MSDQTAVNVFVENRARFLSELPPSSAVLLFTSERKIRSGDTEFPFCPDKDYYYLTGIQESDGRLLLWKSEQRTVAWLFLLQRSAKQAHWFGETLALEEAARISGVAKVLPLDQLEATLDRMLPSAEALYANLEPAQTLGSIPPRVQFTNHLRDRFPTLAIRSTGPILHRMRELKADWEVERIHRAAEVTGEGIRRAMAHTRPGITENELQAHFEFALRCRHCPVAFAPILAGGKNATVLHYHRNDQEVPPGSLILMDVGAEYQEYSADVTRTFPADGRFTDRQRALYEIVLRANEAVIEEIRPGVTYTRLNEVTRQTMLPGLQELGLAESENDVRKYLTHGVSHPLGLDTHDVRVTLPETCREGTVLTVEPGLYLEDEGIGIRIEDDVLVTAEGSRNLTDMIPKSAEEMERLVGGAL